MSASRAWIPIATAALCVALIAAPAEAGKRPHVDGDVLAFELTDLDGNPVRSTDARFAGKVLLVDLWATWCPPCLTEIPTLVELQDRLGERGLTIVAIAFESEEEPDSRRAHLRAFVEEQGINYLVLDGGLPEEFESALPAVRNVRGFPVEILVDRSGRVSSARNGYGYKKSWARKLEREILGLLDAPVEEAE